MKAWHELAALHDRYRAIRDVYDAVFKAVFGAELEVVSPEMGGLVRYRAWYALDKIHGLPIMPGEPAAIMVWLVAGEPPPEPWLPLPDEIEPVISESAERVREEQVARFNAARDRRAAADRERRDEQEERDRVSTPIGGWQRKPVG
jgi:hypothetical protein